MSGNRVAIVTAGGSGMGAGAARRLADDGFKVAILSSSGKGEALARELGGIGVTGSNQSNDDVQRLVERAMAEWGRVDVLVNSAGHGPRAPIVELTDDDWHTGMGCLPAQCRTTGAAGDPDHAGPEIRFDHKHLYVCRV